MYGAHTTTKDDDMERIGVVRGFSDADFAGCNDMRKLTTGWVFMFVNGPISWTSKLQTTVSLSTCEAEYYALLAAGKEAMWLLFLLEELGFYRVMPIEIRTDSEPAMKLAINNIQLNTRTKHIDIACH